VEGLNIFPLDVRGYFHPVLIAQIAQAVRTHGIDVVHSHHSRDLATLVPALRLVRRRVPLVLSKRVGSALRKTDPLHRLTYARVDRVLAISSVIHRNVLATTPMDPERVELLFDAVDTQRFSPSSVADREGVRRTLGLSPAETVIGCVGRLSPGKGHEELLEAAGLLAAQGLQFRLVIAGEPSYGEKEYGDRIRARATHLGLDGIALFTGFRRDVPEIMSALDVFAFPSHAEAFGVVLIEAMAMELPVVSTNCDGVMDIMVDGVTGIMVPPKDPRALAAGLERMLKDPGLRRRYGTAGRVRVLKRFDQSAQTDRLEQIYAGLIGEARHPDAPVR
jgi:glycosyltransferase involved in cell wall biosynthesis